MKTTKEHSLSFLDGLRRLIMRQRNSRGFVALKCSLCWFTEGNTRKSSFGWEIRQCHSKLLESSEKYWRKFVKRVLFPDFPAKNKPQQYKCLYFFMICDFMKNCVSNDENAGFLNFSQSSLFSIYFAVFIEKMFCLFCL